MTEITNKNKKTAGYNILGGGPKANRNDNDLYITPPECPHALMEFLNLDKSITVWECCDAGDGGISPVLESLGYKVQKSDIRTGQDFLTINQPAQAIISNPPFSLADEFITHALSQSPIVCMLLRATFWQAQKRNEFFKANSPAYILPLTWRPDFEKKGSPCMEFAWTVWLPDDNITKYVPLNKLKNINALNQKTFIQ